MDGVVYCDELRLQKQKFNLEEEFEREIKNNSKRLFGNKTIYLDIKKKIESISLGKTIPDGILFDLEDPEDIKFYLIEIELSKHPFYEHIFPQITKFFAFYKNPVSQNNLIEHLYSFILNDPEIKRKFEEFLNGQELYKSIKDAVENNQKILLIIDDKKPEIEEAQKVYTDTWDKLVSPQILSKYTSEGKEVFILEPGFCAEELIIDEEMGEKEKIEQIIYTESYHLSEINPSIVSLYYTLRDYMINIDSSIKVNPQKYYISFRKNRNFAYLDIKKKKIKIAVIVPFEKGREMITNHRLRKFTEGIQSFYGRPSFEVTIENNENLDEVLNLLEEAYREQL